jgi:hypothetical protein
MSLRNCLVLPTAVLVLAFLASCGGSGTSSPTPPPTGAFSNTNFNGPYTFSVAGEDANGVFAMAGTLTACGCAGGNISAGTIDLVSPAGVIPAAAIASNSTYQITSDGRGFARLFYTIPGVSGTNEVDIDFVLTSSSHGLVIRYDPAGTGSGTIDAQASSVALGTTPYTFSLSGADMSNLSFFTIGTFTLGSSGAITTGVGDFNHNGTLGTTEALSGSISLGSGTAPGSATLTSSFGTFSFDVYAVDSTHLKFIESDGQAVMVGDVFDQPFATIPAGNLVFNMSGLDTSKNLFVAAGLITSDGSSQLTNGLEDINDDGVIDNNSNPATPFSFGGTFSATGGSRFLVTLSGFSGGTNFAAYPSSAGVFLLEVDPGGFTTAVTGGTAMVQQSGATLATSQGYGMNLSGEDVTNLSEIDEASEFKIAGTAVTGLVDTNDFSPSFGTITSGNVNGTYSAPSNGTGTITFTKGGVAEIFYYPVDNASALFIAADNSEATMGVVQLQTTPSASAQILSSKPQSIPMTRVLAHNRSVSRKTRTVTNNR